MKLMEDVLVALWQSYHYDSVKSWSLVVRENVHQKRAEKIMFILCCKLLIDSPFNHQVLVGGFYPVG